MTQAKRLEFLIKYLSPTAQLPPSEDEEFQLFRALVNVRKSESIGQDFLRVQDEYLQELLCTRGVVAAETLPTVPCNKRIAIWQGDITTLKIGAIVNAANSGMLGCFCPNHGCIDNAIHTYAGVQLRLACASLMQKQSHPEPTSRAKITSAYNLPCDHVLHTVGPIISAKLTELDCRQLADCYHSCLSLAIESGVESVAFCCISTGEFRFPNQAAAETAVDTVTEFLKGNTVVVKLFCNTLDFIDFIYTLPQKE